MSGPLVLGIETSCDETGAGLVRGSELLADEARAGLVTGRLDTQHQRAAHRRRSFRITIASTPDGW